jgi:hypothetical protein
VRAPALCLVVTGLALVGCAEPDYRAADLQLDIAAPLPAKAATLHLCVVGRGMYDAGAGNGRAAFVGLPVGEPVAVTVDALDLDGTPLGRAEAALGDATRYTTAPWGAAPAAPCEDDGRGVTDDEASWLLAVRFDEEGTPWDGS